MRAYNFFADRQTQTCTFVTPMRAPPETFEQHRHGVSGNTVAVISDCDALPVDIDVDGTAGWRMMDGVLDQVAQQDE